MIDTYFIRHAESTWNLYGDLSKDAPITDRGKNEQASQVSGYVDLVICSTLKRAKQTLEHSKLGYKHVIYTDLCREIKGGTPCDYLEHEDLNEKESDEDVNKRIDELKALILDLTTKHNYKVVGIVSHYCFVHKITGVGMANCQCLKHNFL